MFATPPTEIHRIQRPFALDCSLENRGKHSLKLVFPSRLLDTVPTPVGRVSCKLSAFFAHTILEITTGCPLVELSFAPRRSSEKHMKLQKASTPCFKKNMQPWIYCNFFFFLDLITLNILSRWYKLSLYFREAWITFLSDFLRYCYFYHHVRLPNWLYSLKRLSL